MSRDAATVCVFEIEAAIRSVATWQVRAGGRVAEIEAQAQAAIQRAHTRMQAPLAPDRAPRTPHESASLQVLGRPPERARVLPDCSNLFGPAPVRTLA